MQFIPRLFSFPLAAIFVAFLATGCYKSGDGRKEINEKVEVPRTEVPPAQKLSAKDRLGLRGGASGTPHGASSGVAPATSSPSSGYTWELPEGWEDRGATSMRLANVGIAGHPEVECAFSVLGGDGGGLEANLNRWRQQMGLPHYLPNEVDELPRKPLLGQDAVFTVMDGTYGGMSGENKEADWRMLGLTLIYEGSAYFVKMTGPASVLAEHEDKFLAFSASIREGTAAGAVASALPDTAAGELPPGHPPIPNETALPEGHPPIADGMTLPEGHPPIPGGTATTATALPEGHPPIGAAPVAITQSGGAAAESDYHWHAPEGWVQSPDRPMREVTFNINGAECYIALLGGMAGGVEANINRWVGQMGQPPLSEQEIRALPTITVLGKQAPMVESKGTFTGMSGGAIPNQMMLGVVCPLEGQTLFVKMTGPEEVVSAQAGNFVAFCESIHQGAH